MPARCAFSRCACSVVVALPALLAFGCQSVKPLPTAPTSCEASDSKEVRVYFGCGCFWHVQHEFIKEEITSLCRQDSQLSARTAYAGGLRTDGGLVCYHNSEDKADYGTLGHSEVVALDIPEDEFEAFAGRFWSLCPGGRRQDAQDTGGEYRSVVGLPGGMDSPLMAQLRQSADSVELVGGKGDERDTLGTGSVYVYDTADFPAHVAEKYHQFHDDMMASYGRHYNSLRKWATATSCPGDGSLVQIS